MTYLSKILRLEDKLLRCRQIGPVSALPCADLEAEGDALDRQAHALSLRDDERLRAVIEELSGQVSQKQRELEQMERRALEIVQEAKARALTLVQQANEMADHVRIAAQEEGRIEGVRLGRSDAIKGMAEQIEQSNQILKAAEMERVLRIRSSESAVVALALRIARRIVERELHSDEEYVANMVRQVLGESEPVAKVELRVSAADYVSMLRQRGAIESVLLQPAECLIVIDSTLASGDVVMNTEYGSVDARLEVRFTQVASALFSVAKEWEAHGGDTDPVTTI